MKKLVSHTDGFTLIELVIALSIAASISALLLGGYAFASKAWNRATTTNDGAGGVYAAQSMLRRAFDGLSLQGDKIQFSGNSSSFAFVTLFALPGDPPVPTAIGLDIEECTDGPCVVLKLSRPEWSTRNGETVISAPFARNIQDIAIAYRGRNADAWQEAWPNDAGAPALVRIDLRFHGKSAARWPTLYIAPPSQT